MAELYDVIETTLIWGLVISTIGLVVYLVYLQSLKMRNRRARRRRRAHRAMTQPNAPVGEHRPSHNQQS